MQAPPVYEFGAFRLGAAERLLLRDGEVVALTPKVFDLLVLLVERHGHLLERQALLSAVWADSFVEEANLTVSISALRKALGGQADGRPYIETVPKRGYRFVADVRMVVGEPEDFIRCEQASMPVTIEREEERGDQDEAASGKTTQAQAQAQAPTRRRVRQPVLIAGLVITVIVAGVTYWRLTARGKPVRADAPIRSIAVLPFRQTGEGEKEESVGFGMADVLITKLGSLNRIAVRPTSAVCKYINAEPDVVSVGRELNVEAVIEGNIQQIDGRIRVTARLVRARDGELLWAEAFDGRFKDQFGIQDKLSEHVAAALLLSPADEQKKLLTKRYTDSAEAYQTYMKGRYFWNKRTADGLQKAVEYFEQAIEQDASYALAFAGLADAYAMLGDYSVVAPKAVFPKMHAAAARAVEIDDQLAEAHTSLAYAKMLADWDWSGAEQEFQRAIALNDSYATAHHWYSEYLAARGRFDEALEEAKRAQELDPQSLIINTNIGWVLYLAHRYDEAMEKLKKTLEMDQDFFIARSLLWQTYVMKRMYREAITGAGMRVQPLSEEDQKKRAGLIRAYETSGRQGFHRKLIELDIRRLKSGNVSGYSLAMGYAQLGENDSAFKWLQKAFEDHEANIRWLKVDPFLDGIRSDPRFAGLLRMCLEP